jgi:hypothetical protein
MAAAPVFAVASLCGDGDEFIHAARGFLHMCSKAFFLDIRAANV